MNEIPPCKGCTERFTACSDQCPKDERGEYGYKAWKERFQAQQKHLKENKYRFSIPMTESRKNAYDKYYHSKNSKYKKGGEQ